MNEGFYSGFHGGKRGSVVSRQSSRISNIFITVLKVRGAQLASREKQSKAKALTAGREI